MPTVQIPYHTSHVTLEVPPENLLAVLHPPLHQYRSDKTEAEIIEEALASPIGSPPLRELAKGKRRVTLVTSDHTRAVPSKKTLPYLLAEIRKGNPAADITILIATGLHRATTPEEQLRMFGDAIVDNEKIVVHDAFKEQDMRYICPLPSGAGFTVHKLAVDCDLLLTEGFIEPHFFAGFSGGRKSILPGICSAETVSENHSYKAIAHPGAAAGSMEQNPINQDMIFAARKMNVAFTFNVALDAEKNIIAAFAGDVLQSHDAGCAFVRGLSAVPKVEGDIVVTGNGGYPLDQNLYQTPKAISTAEACAGENGVIIMCASCVDGIGGSHFERLMRLGSPAAIDKELSAIAPKDTIPEQWCAQVFARILQKHPIILVTTFLDHEVVRQLNMIPAMSPDEALALARQIKGHNAKIVVIPDGVAAMVQTV